MMTFSHARNLPEGRTSIAASAITERAAPFRANDQMLALRPVCVLVLPESLGRAAEAGAPPFGPAMNLAEEARRRGLRCVRIASRP